MKISYINLRKKVVEYANRIRQKNNKKEDNKNDNKTYDDTKFIGINCSKDNKKEKNKVLNNLRNAPKGSYALLLCMIILLVVTTGVNLNTHSKLSKEDYTTYIADEQYDIQASNNNVIIYQEAVSSVYEIGNKDEEVIEVSSSNIQTSNKDIIEEEKYVYEYSYIRPVSGNTIKEYSMDKVIYSKTLDMWKVHDGIDISAAVGENVKASEAGTIERVYEDALYGYSIIINHQNGIKTIYRNLDKEVKVKENEKVEKGKVIGTVGNSAISECMDESHIHFEVVKNGEIVNPNIIGIK